MTRQFPGLYFRSVLPADKQQLQQLHEEWFPVQYHQDFYDTLVYGRLVTPTAPSPSAETGDSHNSGSENSMSRPLFTYLGLVDPDYQVDKDEDDLSMSTGSLISMEEARGEESLDVEFNLSSPQPIVGTERPSNHKESTDGLPLETTKPLTDPPTATSQQQNQHEDSVSHRIAACIVGAKVEIDILPLDLQQILVPDPREHGNLFYIMTLGTHEDFRSAGLATFMIQECIRQVILPDVTCGTLYLHVLDTNTPAIRFYEKLGFHRVKLIPNYYNIDGRLRHCYLYAKYFHGNRGHLTIFHLLQQSLSIVWNTLWRAPYVFFTPSTKVAALKAS